MRAFGFHLGCMIAVLVAAAAFGCAHDDPTLVGSSHSNSTKAPPNGQAPNAPGDNGDDGEGAPGDYRPDGGGGGGDNDAGPSGPACIDPASSPGDGHHNAGQDCISCHQTVPNANWTIAGTLYRTATGGAAVSGVTIEIVDANGQTIQLVTSDNGNFYTDQDVAFPVQTRASSCPLDQAMTAPANQGSCNAGGCHESGNRIHL
jgi:hypothetical protein